MDRIILVTCVVFLVVNFYIDVVVSAPYYDTSLDDKTEEEEDEIKISPMWFSPRLGKRKRHLKEDSNKIPVELANILDALEDSPIALITVNTNGKYKCKNVEGKNNNSRFIPRLGRNLDDDKENERLVQDTDTTDNMAQRSPPFAPRLGRRLSPYSPRLGRES